MGGVAGSAQALGHLVTGTAPNGFNGEWDDLPGKITMAGGVSALTFERFRDAPHFRHFFRSNVSEMLYQEYQMRHTWKVGTFVRLHIHCVPMATWAGAPATKAVMMQVAYYWSVPGVIVPGSAGWSIVPVALDFSAADQYKDMIMGLAQITPPANAKASSILHTRIARLTGDAGDTYKDNKDHGTPAANFSVSDIDCHYQRDKAGTVTEYPT